MAKKMKTMKTVTAAVRQWQSLGNNYTKLGGSQNTSKAQKSQVATSAKGFKVK